MCRTVTGSRNFPAQRVVIVLLLSAVAQQWWAGWTGGCLSRYCYIVVHLLLPNSSFIGWCLLRTKTSKGKQQRKNQHHHWGIKNETKCNRRGGVRLDMQNSFDLKNSVVNQRMNEWMNWLNKTIDYLLFIFHLIIKSQLTLEVERNKVKWVSLPLSTGEGHSSSRRSSSDGNVTWLWLSSTRENIEI